MVAFFDTLKLSFLILGAILGAGFVSGKELITFFGSGGYLVFFTFSCLLFFIIILSLFLTANREEYNSKGERALNIAIYFCSFIVSVSSLSGLDELLKSEVYNLPFSIYSIILLLITFIICLKGVRGVEKVNFIIVPILIFLTVYVIFKNNDYTYQAENTKKLPFINCVLYVFLNIFSNIKIITMGAKDKGKKILVCSAIIISAVIFVLGIIILLSLSSIKDIDNFAIPILRIANNKLDCTFIAVALFFAMFSSLIADVCPLIELAKNNKDKNFYLTLLFIILILFSQLGINKIVKYLYPVVGLIGLIYFIWCIKSKVKSIMIMEVIMKKKNKVKKLTDEEYQQYIMSLKDEKPPLLIRQTKKD